MTNIAAAWTNIALNATLTASSEATNMLVTKLQQEDTRRNFRTGGVTTVNIDLTYAATQSADTFFLANTNLTAAGIVRIKLSNVSLGGTDIWDSNSGDVAGTVDPNYKNALVLASSVKSGWKYARIVLTDTSLTYLEAGFLFIGARTQFDYDCSWAANRTRIDPSIHKTTQGGQTKIKRRTPFFRWELPLNIVTDLQRWIAVEQIDLLNGVTLPVLFIINPASANLGRDSIFGLIQELSPVFAVQAFDSLGGVITSKTYKVDQRL